MSQRKFSLRQHDAKFSRYKCQWRLKQTINWYCWQVCLCAVATWRVFLFAMLYISVFVKTVKNEPIVALRVIIHITVNMGTVVDYELIPHRELKSHFFRRTTVRYFQGNKRKLWPAAKNVVLCITRHQPLTRVYRTVDEFGERASHVQWVCEWVCFYNVWPCYMNP